MTDLRALVQDLRAEAHRAPGDIADLMRRAAEELDDRMALVPVRKQLVRLTDFEPTPAPFGPPACDIEAYEQGTASLS